MKYSAAVLLAAAAGQASASAITHRHAAGKVHNHALRHAEIMHEAHVGKRDLLSKAAGLGAKMGANAWQPTSNAWLGNATTGTTKGAYTNTFSNDSGQNLVLFCWGPAGSWVNAVAPLISHPMGPGEQITVNYAEGASGACSAVYPDTTMVNGQIYNTWLEYTFAGIYSTYDVSREVNMNGHSMSTKHVQASGATGCVSDMNTCVFVCPGGQPSCWTGYQLLNCGAANGGGSGYDPVQGGAAGGCNGLSSGNGNLFTSLQ